VDRRFNQLQAAARRGDRVAALNLANRMTADGQPESRVRARHLVTAAYNRGSSQRAWQRALEQDVEREELA
jgi:hypothetical protein